MKYTFFIFPLFFLFSLVVSENAQAQTQIGADIDGEMSTDESGYSVSMPDSNTLAIGAPFNNDTGHVRIYRWNGTIWQQKGQDIDGEDLGDQSGFSVSMPDSNTVAIGAQNNDGTANNAGHVRIYRWDGTMWLQKGLDIDGEAANDRSGYSVSMPDSNTVAVGAYANSGNGFIAGHVRVYQWDGSAWQQKGVDIDGDSTGDNCGYSVSMPDSLTVAVGAPLNDGNGTNSGHVRIFRWNGSAWIQKGNDIDGERSGDGSGNSVSMPDSNTVAIGAPFNNGNGTNSGQVRVYHWNGIQWQKRGADIDGEAADDRSGLSVSMPDSNTVAIGTPFNRGNGLFSGHVRIFRWNSNNWIQKAMDIDSEASGDQSGWSVNMPTDNIIAIGARNNDGNGSNSGHVRVYSICTADSTIDSISACNSYTWLDNVTYTSSTNNPTYTFINSSGCDSVLTLNLTINSSTNSVDSVTACDSYTWIDNNTYTSSNNSATFVTTNSNGCDSIITLDLTIKNSTDRIDTVTACDSYTWLDNNTYTSSNNTATLILTNAVGCDSIVRLDLTIYSNDTSVILSNDTLIANQTGATYQWLNCDSNLSVISGATSQSYTPNNNGSYACEITLNGCIDTTTCVQRLTTKIEEEDYRAEELKIFPNPFNNQLIIEENGTNLTSIIKINNLNGDLVFETTFNASSRMSINTSSWSKGIYFLRLVNDLEVKSFKLIHN